MGTSNARRLAIAGSLVAVAFAAPGFADSMGKLTAEDARSAHAEVDTNNDGFVDREEFYRRMVDVFYHNDVDRNGYLDRDEVVAMQEGMVFAPADEDGDGKLTMGEYIDQRFVAFRKADDDSDGLISVDEVIQVYTAP
jgi:hypothetical protein